MVALAFLYLSACTASGGPSGAPLGDGVSERFQVVSHGWHTGILIRRNDLAAYDPQVAADFPGAGYLEIGWGDARYYVEPEPSAGLALRALLWPSASVLHVSAFSDFSERYFPESEIVGVCVDRIGYHRLLDFIASTFDRGTDGEIARLGSGLYGTSRFYKARGSFHAFNTCNTWVAEAVANAGHPLSTRFTVTSGRLMSQLRRDPGTPVQCTPLGEN
ncbi:MAG: DUF2459 domain-containing protein [Desulfobacterales bacterium]